MYVIGVALILLMYYNLYTIIELQISAGYSFLKFINKKIL